MAAVAERAADLGRRRIAARALIRMSSLGAEEAVGMAAWAPTAATYWVIASRPKFTAQGRPMEALHSQTPLGRAGVREIMAA